MKRLLCALALLCLAAPVWAGDDPFAAFRIPEHRYSDLSLSLSASGSRQRYSGTRSFYASPYASVAHGIGWDSDLLQAEARVSGYGLVDWRHSLRNLPNDVYDAESQEQRGSGSADLTLRRYRESGALGVELGATLTGSTRIIHESIDQARPYSGSLEQAGRYTSDRTWSSGVNARLGVVRGRVRDAGVVYAVHAIEERLRATGALTRDLSPAGREHLAELLSLRGTFSEAHDRPERFFAAELERVLREDGAIAEGGLDALSTLRALEALEPSSYVTRPVGSRIGAYVRESHSHALWDYDYTYYDRLIDPSDGSLYIDYHFGSHSRDHRPLDEQWLGLSFDLHRPVGWAWQLDLASAIERPLQFGDAGMGLTVDAAARWRIADRWDAGARLLQIRTYLESRGDGEWQRHDDWEVYATADVGFYVEDHVRLSASVTEDQYRMTRYGFSSFTEYTTYRLGLSYRFLGRLDSPVLAGPVRPLR